MTDIIIRPRADQKFDIYVYRSGEPIMNSSQGYSRAIDAEDIVRKVFSGNEKLARIRAIVEAWGWSAVSRRVLAVLDEVHEPVRLTIEYRDGRVKSEVIG